MPNQQAATDALDAACEKTTRDVDAALARWQAATARSVDASLALARAARASMPQEEFPNELTGRYAQYKKTPSGTIPAVPPPLPRSKQ